MKYLWDCLRYFLRKEPTNPRILIYTWNGLNPEIIRKNWRPGDEYWVLVWWKNFNTQSVYYSNKPKERTMNETINTNPAAEDVVAVPVAKLTDAEVEALLASKPESAPVAVAEADEEAPTVH